MCVERAIPTMSHLQFTDNSIFLCKKELHECDEVMKAVKVYWKPPGQCINFEKSPLLFGKSVCGDTKKEIKST